ncbi:MAG: hypothetical protein WAW42_02290 [Candidatus Competibacteraceae bacterium]
MNTVVASEKGEITDVGRLCLTLREKFPPETADMIWIQALGQESDWFMLPADQFRKHGNLERKALRQSQWIVFCLGKSALTAGGAGLPQKLNMRHQCPKSIPDPFFRSFHGQNHER